MTHLEFENIYEIYSPLMYGVAKDICGSKDDAELLLIETFNNIYKEDIKPTKNHSFSFTIMRLVVDTAKKLHPEKTSFMLNIFRNFPIMNHLLCNQLSVHDYCNVKSLSYEEVLLNIRKEFSVIKGIETKYPISLHKIDNVDDGISQNA